MRTCSLCHHELPLTDFPRDRSQASGRSYKCKPCNNAGRQQRYAASRLRDFEALDLKLTAENHRKICTKCGIDAPFTDFHRSKTAGDGRVPWCKVCNQSRSSAYYKSTAGKQKADLARTRDFDALLEKYAAISYHKVCSICKESKLFSQFHVARRQGDGLQGNCKPCANSRKYTLWTTYRLTEERFNEMVEEQHGCCAICKQAGLLVVDHDHACCPASKSCGKCVRALLCNGCNSALGHIRDDSYRAIQLAQYLERHAE